MRENVVVAANSRKRKRIVARTLIAAAAAGALAWGVLASVPQGAAGGPSVAVADDAPGYAVEDFDYPQADRIEAEQGILLKRGDGHITLVDCSSGTGFIEVLARRTADKVCFESVGDSGWLTLEIPAVYSMRGNDYDTQVDMTVGDEEKSFDLEQNTWTPVGESADEQNREHLLVEIRTSK